MRLVSSDVVVPASDFDLTTLASVKLEFNITTTDQDVYLTSLIRRVSGAISSYCRRVFARQTYQDTFVAHGEEWSRYLHGTWGSHGGLRGSLFVANRPVIGGSLAVTRDGQTLVDGQDYRLFGDIGKVEVLRGLGREVVATYDAGWILPGWPNTGGSTLPDAIEGAAIMAVLGMRQAGRLAYTDRDPFLRSETVEGVGRRDYSQTAIGSSSGGAAMDGMAPSVATALAPYVIPVGV